MKFKKGFNNLPAILLTAMRNHPIGVMIARGDLALEVGWKHLAQIQEEILWLCEAVHIPIVWATQVLETLSKKGRPSRAEITDAAMAELFFQSFPGFNIICLDEFPLSRGRLFARGAPSHHSNIPTFHHSRCEHSEPRFYSSLNMDI